MTAPALSLERPRLWTPGYVGLLVTQFLGTINDNMFRWLAVPLAKAALAGDSAAGDALALSLGLACFTLPYLLLASPAGYLADRFSKRSVIVWCKFAEIAIMGLGLAAIASGNMTFLFIVVALMGAQSALFSPAKYGSLPEMVPAERLSQGNGFMSLATVVASAMGFLAGSYLFSLTAVTDAAGVTSLNLIPASIALIGVATVGWFTSFLVASLPAADASRSIPWNPLGETWRGLRLLGSQKALLRASLGIAFFWFLASLANVNIDSFGIRELGLEQKDIGPLMGVLVLGLGAGSVLAGWWSGGKVELGIVPIGATIITISSLSLSMLDSGSYGWSMFWLATLGLGAGLFNVPLDSFLQHRSEAKQRGTILAANNFITFSMMLVSAGLFWLLNGPLQMSASKIFLVAGLGTVPVIIYVVWLLPQATIRCVVWLLTRTVYRVRITGRENLPETGGALLVANHVSWIDGVLLLTTSSRPIRMIAYADYVEGGFIGKLAKLFGVIPIKPTEGPKSIIKALKTAHEALVNGDLVCIFAEGSITRTGQLLPFQRGLLKILDGADVPVIPIYLDGLWGSIFSYSGGKFFWKRPRQWPYPISISFGPELRNPDNVHEVRQAVQNLGVEAMEERKTKQLIPPRIFLRKCRSAGKREKVADSSGASLSGSKLLIGTLVMRRLLRKYVLGKDEQNVGILLPPSVGGTVVNTAVAVDGRVAVNLNYTMSDDVNNYCIKQAGIKHVLTSKRFLEKSPANLDAEMVLLEDLKTKAGLWDKIVAVFMAFCLPMFLLERILGLTNKKPDDLFSIIFTSGSTGEPKGVMLSYNNVMSNIIAVDQVFHIKKEDVFLGILPFFHSFGFTGTLWLVLCLEPKGVYHFNPLDARMVGKLCEDHGVTLTMATPTFLRGYLKRCTPEQFSKLDTVITGAEKLPPDLAEEFEKKFGVYPTEGYGTTELSPVASVNVPPHRAGSKEQIASKPGTIGRPLNGVTAKVTDPDTGAELGPGQPGILWIKGQNVMRGYLNQPEKTADVIKDGWYNTGDVALIDDEGFITITGRLSRFSKIGGEMVPHVRIENALAAIIGSNSGGEEETGPVVAVTAVPDDKKGERIVVLHRPISKPLDEVLNALSQTGMPNIWLPGRDSFVEVDQIPLLGTGKLDLRGIKEAALRHFSPEYQSADR